MASFDLHNVDIELPDDRWSKQRSIMKKEYLDSDLTKILMKQELFTPLSYGNGVVYYLRFKIDNARYTYDISKGIYQVLYERGCIRKSDVLVVYDCEMAASEKQTTPIWVTVIMVHHKGYKALNKSNGAYLKRFLELLQLKERKDDFIFPACLFDYDKCGFFVSRLGRNKPRYPVRKSPYRIREVITKTFVNKK